MDHQLYGDPSANSFSPLEAQIFSGQLPPSPPWPNLDVDLDLDLHVLEDDIVRELSGRPANAASSGSGSGGPGSHKKLSHNAYERDRRKQLNELYLSLRSLLPDADHTKKLSIPTTVCRALKYIPELQKQVENLEKKKEKLASANCKPGVLSASGSIAPTVSATCLNDKEIMVQISLLRGTDAATALPLSKCINVLENEGLQLISSSTSSTFGNKTFYNLHLQRSQGALNMECPSFCDILEQAIRKTAGLYLQH
ncbi:protein IRON-RELATED TRANSCRIPTION FACTOR 2 [Aegilops tauschii subsp. strangulata]|uniref:Protein IRON-RELATED TRANSCRIPTION FACTOR 2 n=1 Tax=Aegilops tauschii subsp. strangulata TaxID=200361 RepID=A0A453D8B6_AEGTS|nr:protein IRON-RELATED TRANSCRIPTION FACTOR 2 [Aegilops tauschii subsp. strangulata]